MPVLPTPEERISYRPWYLVKANLNFFRKSDVKNKAVAI